jgi:hypothetical protein
MFRSKAGYLFIRDFPQSVETVGQTKFIASELPFHGWKSPEIAWGEI